MSLTVEGSNFLRFYYLNLTVASKAVRVHFDSVHPPAALAYELAKSSATLGGLRFITNIQWKTLYPSPASSVKSEHFDTTLIVCLLRNMTPRAQIPVKGWDDLPHAGDTSKCDDLARVKWYRNMLAHHGDGKLSTTEFSQYWGELECAIGRLGGPLLLREAQSVQHIVLDKSLKDILNLYHNQTTIKQELELKIQQLADSFQRAEIGAQQLATEFWAIKGLIETCIEKIEDYRKEFEKIEQKMKGLEEKDIHTQGKLDDLTLQVLRLKCNYDIKVKEDDEQFTKYGEMMATCKQDINDLKQKAHATDDSPEGRKRKRLEDDINTLIEGDLKRNTFVRTKAVKHGLSLLQHNGVLLITGCAGTGKSLIGRHILHMYCTDNRSYKCIKLKTLDEWEDMVRREDNVVVLLDDIFGETNCVFNREKDIPILDQIYAYMYVCKGNIKVIITIRNTVKCQCQKVFDIHNIFKFDFIDLSSKKYILSVEEKSRIFTKYMDKFRPLEDHDLRGYIDRNGVTILDIEDVCKIVSSTSVKGFPLAINQFVHNNRYFKLGSKFFDRPTKAMLAEMNDIRRNGEDQQKSMMQYAVMVYTAINRNCINPNDSSDRKNVEKMIKTIYGKTMKLKKIKVSDAVNDIKGRFLVSKPNEVSYRYEYSTVRESAILSFAQIDDENINNIMPSLSWSFFIRMVKSDVYIEKEDEVVLKIPSQSYKLLAYRLIDLYLTDDDIDDVYCFLEGLIDTEVFQQKGHVLVTYLLEAFEMKDNTCDEQTKNKPVFFDDFLNVISKRKRHFEVYNLILQKCNEVIKRSTTYVTIDFMKAAMVASLYEICSTKDVSCVKVALHLVKENNLIVLLDQGISLTSIGITPRIATFTSDYQYNENKCVFLTFCISKAYKAFNESVLEYLLSMYNKIPFDVNLFLKMFYSTDRNYGLSSLSYKPLKWMMDRFEVDMESILKCACRCHLFDIVKYLSSRCKTFDAVSCLEIFLYIVAEDNVETFKSNFRFDKKLFNFLFSKIDITSLEMNHIVIAILGKQFVPNYVGDALLPFCINSKAILNLACKEAHFYITQLILENSQNINLQSALISACTGKRSEAYMPFDEYVEDANVKIVEFIVGKYGYEQFDLKFVCQQAYQTRMYNIIEWLVLNIDITLLDVQCIMDTALVRKRTNILESIINKTDLTSLDKIDVLKSVTQHYNVGCSTQIEQIVSLICDRTEDNEVIIDMAYEHKCFELIIWIYEKRNLHSSIDAKKVLMLACEDGRIDILKWILDYFKQTPLNINGSDLFRLALQNMSSDTDHIRKISTVKWVIENFQIKPFNIKLGGHELISSRGYVTQIAQEFLKLGVYIQKKYFDLLSGENKVQMMNICLEQKFYDIVHWLLEEESLCSFNKQTILNHACADAQIEIIKMLNRYFSSLDMNEAVLYACTGYDISVCEYLLEEIDHDTLDMSTIVTIVCNEGRYLGDNIMKWIIVKFLDDQNIIKEVLISCCRQGKFNLLKYIFLKVPNEQLDILTAFYEACLYPDDKNLKSENCLCVIDFLFQKLPDKSCNSADVVSGILENKRYDIMLYFLEQGYCRIIDMKHLLNEACRYGYFKLVQWILQHVDHTELDIKSAFLAACNPADRFSEFYLQGVALMWHYIQDINMFDVDTVLKSMRDEPPDMLNLHLRNDMINWLLYIKNINQTNEV